MYRKNKRLGQHFLTDQSILKSIVNFVDLKSGQIVYEIGPGAGALTHCLLGAGLIVNAIELDKRWCQWLLKKYEKKPLNVIPMDALQFNWASLTKDDVIVGNLPYNIASELMCRWAEYSICMNKAILMMQKEVADRALANSGSKDYGRLSIILQTFFGIKACLNVPPESFDPPPKVQSSIIELKPLKTPLCTQNERLYLQKITAAAFSQRRKKCKHGLSQYFSEQELRDLNINPESRPQDLLVEQYV